ncbi:class I SAM-dependent methyltransferase [Methylobacterium organophilum]|uniref:class I SAM-dependent methyltransferase n=1 Tax=Methylobacterium organophilum TaxID=410 RepID=UPI0019D20F8F|nr:class I SAM-dependent methyltransferase [Methylobacterium organophilum]MBN6819551.1 class I SAM-dependent methyltransferase [Methylobacterium organophilum]
MRHRENNQHAHAERGNDLYETPPEAVRALLEVEFIPDRVWEPACGPGSIVRVLREAGHAVIASDLIDYGWQGQNDVVDFLRVHRAPAGASMIVTNPPFKIANAFVAHALHLCPRVAMLLRLGFLAGTKRTPILEGGLLARIHVFKRRLPMMHRHGWEGPKATSQTEFAWFIFDRAHFGPALINRIDWKRDDNL